ncbi:MAG: energy transducer TonB [Hyphomonadaceae bacterium]
MREHAPQSTRLAGAITAATMTLAFGYAMANGMGGYIADHMPDALIYVAMPDTSHADPFLPPTASQLDTESNAIPFVAPLFVPDTFYPEDPPIRVVLTTGSRRDTGPVTPTPPTPPTSVRTAAKMIPAASPNYPPGDIRLNHQGTSALEVCVDTGGRVTSASLTSSSGYDSLDQAALKWVRDRKFTPAKLDGRPQSICDHPVVYEWKLNRR